MGKRSGGDLPVAVKFALGFVVLAAGFFVFGGSGYFAGPDGKVSLWWMILGYGLMSLGELLISGLGLAMVARYVGPKLRGFLMGTWFLATGISQYLGSYVATFASVPGERDRSEPDAAPLHAALLLARARWRWPGRSSPSGCCRLMKRLSAESRRRRAPPRLHRGLTAGAASPGKRPLKRGSPVGRRCHAELPAKAERVGSAADLQPQALRTPRRSRPRAARRLAALSPGSGSGAPMEQPTGGRPVRWRARGR